MLFRSEKVVRLKEKLGGLKSHERADLLVREALPLMQAIRSKCDAAEVVSSAEIWPYPIYRSLLSLSA